MNEQDTPLGSSNSFDLRYQIGEFRFAETSSDTLIQAPNRVMPSHSAIGEEATPSGCILDQARSIAPFPILLPAWLPDGYALEPMVQMISPPTVTAVSTHIPTFPLMVCLIWRKPNSDFIALDITEKAAPSTFFIRGLYREIDTLQEVRINGEPAALILRAQGSTPELRAMFPQASMRLLWHVDEAIYELRSGYDMLSANELIRVAESIQSEK